jgi:hypothetical protein
VIYLLCNIANSGFYHAEILGRWSKTGLRFKAYRILPEGLADIECQITAVLLPTECYVEPPIQGRTGLLPIISAHDYELEKLGLNTFPPHSAISCPNREEAFLPFAHENDPISSEEFYNNPSQFSFHMLGFSKRN